MQSISQIYDLAFQYHQAGNLPQAESLYRQILQVDPRHADALHFLGVIAHQVGRSDLAVDTIRQALRLNPAIPAAHNNVGMALRTLGRLDEAITHYQEALRLLPDFAEAYSNLGIALQDQGKLDEAISSYQQALRVRPDFAEAYNNLGNALRDQGRLAEAMVYLQQALTLKPHYADAHRNLGVALQDQGRFDAAIAHYQEALRLQPHYPEAYCNLGNALQGLDKFDEAIASYEQALRQKPGYGEAHYNIGIALHDQGKVDEAIASFRQTMVFKPELPEAHHNLGVTLLLRGDYTEGWPKYEWRWRTTECKAGYRSFAQPLWQGQPLPDGTILLHHEQGLGDTIQFIRFAALVKQRVGTVHCDCPADLVGLLRSCAGIDRIITTGEPLPPFEAHAPLLSLPAILKTTLETLPAATPYLGCDADLVERWRGRLTEGDEGRPALRVGIVWQGNPIHKKDRQRSVRLEQFAPLAALPGVRLISLQKGLGTEQLEKTPGVAIPLGHELTDVTDTAAVIRCLDLVISVDTMVAHLAGALGKPVWVVLAKIPDWRWLLQREDSPWYPSMRLFRQTAAGQWDEVFRRIKDALASYSW